MKPEDPICLCFHVTRRKVINFIRVEKPTRPSQLSECFGAGTGCGWCRPYLERILAIETAKRNRDDQEREKQQQFLDDLSREEYASGRARYVQEGGGTPPPGATPPDPTPS